MAEAASSPACAHDVTHDDTRRALRDQMRGLRDALPARVRLGAAEALATQLRRRPELSRPGRVAGYWAVRGEMPLHALFAPAPAFDYFLPCLGPDRTLRFAPWRTGDALRPNRYGIPEPDVPEADRLLPTALDVVLVPLLAFDRRGTRLGSGGGFYDRSFAFLRERERPAHPLLVGVGYAFQEVAQLPAAGWDVALDHVVTEAGSLDCHVARTAPD
jgi:5-formyltetrahydrofolate cyclo-ligase